MVEVGQPHRQHRDQALAARQDFGTVTHVTQLGQHPRGVFDGVGAVVIERGGFHRSASLRSDAIDDGLAGSRVIVTPSGASASLMALITAGTEPMAPPSPAPL